MRSLDNITWNRLENDGAVTYPSLSENDPGQPIVFGEGFPRPEGRAKFTPASVIAPDETPDVDYPMILTTGRQLEHWHTGSMTRRASVLDALEPEPEVHIAPETLQSLQVKAGDLVRVVTRRGEIELAARIDPKLPSGMIFVPFCFYEAPANYLTNPALDPYGKIPELKFAAARIEAVQEVAAE